MKILKQLLDKIFFTFGVIIFLQLPHFIDQYTQRIGGYAESKQQQLLDYQTIADKNYNGDLSLLIDKFKTSDSTAVRETGENIRENQFDVQALNNEIKHLEQDGLFNKVLFLTTNIRYKLAKGTLGAFKPGIPLNIWSLVYGLVGGILFSLIFNGVAKTPKIIFRKKKNKTPVYSAN